MPSRTENQVLVCEQCGAPLPSRTGVSECLHCLLQAGIEPEKAEKGVAPDESGTRFYHHYEILTRPDGSRWELGRGAMGVTYKARDINLDTPVALKIIAARFSGRPDARRRFLREAQAAARLRHPNVASVFHFGTINTLPALEGAATTAEERADAGDCFYAMEFVEGETLEARLRRGGPLTPALALEIGLQVARALAAAEHRGLVHRDLKPSNIMLAAEVEEATAQGMLRVADEAWVKVIDFGLAKLCDKAEQPATSFFGTAAFASPEQIEVREVDARSDVYSLGATLWYSLTGKVPFPDRSPNELNDPGKRASPPVAQLAERDVPASVIALLASALAPNPDDRPRSAAAFGQALQNCLDDLSGVGRKVIPLPRSRARKWALAGGGLGIAAGLIGLAIFLASANSPPADKSIAVLSFRNLSNDPADAFFAEGVQDDILSRLVKIRDLKVINHLGTSRYPADAPRDLRAIGRTLGVRHLLEGSLRRSGDRVLLHVSLIDARGGHEVWTEGYDRKLVDAINLQGELASDIADALDAKLSPRERGDVRANSTRNPDAYVLYLRGRKLENSLTIQISNYEAAQALYTQAVALDPGFALAHARLASALGLLYRFRGPSDELEEKASEEVRQALRLQPDLGEAHLAKALNDYRIERDFDRALPELEIARRLLPNDTEPESMIALIRRRQGRWREARADLEHVLSLDPLNRRYEEELHATACLLRDWPAAALHADRAVAMTPAVAPLRLERALVDYWRNGILAPLQTVLAGIKSFPDVEGDLTWERWDAAVLARDFAGARAAIDAFSFETLPTVLGAPIPKSYFAGCIWLAQGENTRAQESFEAARPSMEAETLAHPNDAMRHARLGLLYAYMGRKTDAIREGERATRLMPVSKDALDGHQWQCNLALIRARIGHTDQALSMIESLLRQPGCVSPLNEASLTLWDLRLRWQWDPLRSDPRFQKILAGPEPPTIF